jgi:hypothetical protein
MRPNQLLLMLMIVAGIGLLPSLARAQTATATPTATATSTATATATATATTTATATATATPSCSITSVPSGNGLSGRYTCCSTSVTSATVPVTILPGTEMSTWNFRVASGGGGIFVFPYQGSLITTVGQTPANIYPVDGGQSFGDAQTCESPNCRNAMGEAWGALLQTGDTPVTEYTCYR